MLLCVHFFNQYHHHHETKLLLQLCLLQLSSYPTCSTCEAGFSLFTVSKYLSCSQIATLLPLSLSLLPISMHCHSASHSLKCDLFTTISFTTFCINTLLWALTDLHYTSCVLNCMDLPLSLLLCWFAYSGVCWCCDLLSSTWMWCICHFLFSLPLVLIQFYVTWLLLSNHINNSMCHESIFAICTKCTKDCF